MFRNGVFTGVLSGYSFTITEQLGIRGLCIRYISGTVSFTGAMLVEGLTPSSRPLVDGYPYGISSQFPIDEFTIDASAGVCEITLIR